MFSSPKTIRLDSVVKLPPGLPVRPELLPKKRLLLPPVTASPAACPTQVLEAPVQTDNV